MCVCLWLSGRGQETILMSNYILMSEKLLFKLSIQQKIDGWIKTEIIHHTRWLKWEYMQSRSSMLYGITSKQVLW